MVNVIKDLMMDVNLHFSEGEMWMSGVDPEHVGVVNWRIQNSSIVSDGAVVGVYMTAIYKFLRNAEKDDDLLIEVGDQTGIKFRLKNEKRDISYFFYNLIIPETAINVTLNHYDGHVFIKASLLQKNFRDIAYSSKVINVKVDKMGNLTFTSKGDSGIGSFTLSVLDERLTWAYRHFDSYDCCFYLQYFDKFIKSNIADYISVKFDKLIYLNYEVSDDDIAHSLTLGLAPFAEQNFTQDVGIGNSFITPDSDKLDAVC